MLLGECGKHSRHQRCVYLSDVFAKRVCLRRLFPEDSQLPAALCTVKHNNYQDEDQPAAFYFRFALRHIWEVRRDCRFFVCVRVLCCAVLCCCVVLRFIVCFFVLCWVCCVLCVCVCVFVCGCGVVASCLLCLVYRFGFLFWFFLKLTLVVDVKRKLKSKLMSIHNRLRI
jgi:hypothetical protein